MDQPEFVISQSEVDIGTIDASGVVYTSTDELTVTVRTVGA